MKKLIVMLFAVSAMSVMAADSYLYWMVNDNAFAWDNARLSDGSSYMTLYSAADGSSLGKSVGYVAATDMDIGAYALLNGAVGSSFLVELCAGDAIVARSGSFDISALGQYITQSILAPGSSPYAVSGFTAVPEPTSGLLMLFGLAGLALRRRRLA